MGHSKNHNNLSDSVDFLALAQNIKQWGEELGFQQVGISDTHLEEAERHLLNWLQAGRHGTMEYMQRHGTKRSRPAQLVPGTLRIISVRMDYYPPNGADAENVLNQAELGFISRYALGRDYHKVVRKRLQKLVERIEHTTGAIGYRVFADSAPVLEKAIAEKAGLGWIGKHSNLLHKKTGSWFFLGEIYTDLPLPIDTPAENHCGSCHACIDICPTRAIVAPYKVDARLCISYLTIELRGSIPVELRPLMGNRIYGCDDCQLACPWNRFAKPTATTEFFARSDLDAPRLLELFSWTEEQFLQRMEGSPIRRIGYECWIRNIAVALGNAPTTRPIITALQNRLNDPSPLVVEHVAWALDQHTPRCS